ncbi:MAG: glutathione peroxidase [Gemmatimonadetes bacterium]|jgi:glutathione peroxidase|nr:glutathione peroxidase [Gemmatimonadota bacterium]MBT5449614.1 glutathione peroxidase [Gemmatimonadota bacterium]MBT6621110.1 glutathione peroxidase [Gemmatimonadota bacterium]MBT6906212.1 glutathione peroxidase [Gemmatimonadota bacterium]MBT7422514.1 glutathione peroxidase [Gemmatimonadota bacterium]
MSNAHNFNAQTIQGEPTSLADYAGKALLVVNVASECGLTKQYTGLEELHRKYGEQGLAILGFPCNQFGAQEPGSEAQILEFCQTKYDVSFPLYAKIDVNGTDRHPLYAHLAGEEDITWNFEKFLIDKEGNTLARFEPKTTPDDPDLVAAIEKALA